MEEMGEKLKRIRNSKKMLQGEVAKLAGISRNAYVFIETGKVKNISLETAKGIAKAFNVPFSELFDIETYPEEIEKLRDEIRNLQESNNNSSKIIIKLTEDIQRLHEITVFYLVQLYTIQAEYQLGRISSVNDENDKKRLTDELIKFLKETKSIVEKDIAKGYLSKEAYLSFINFGNRFEGTKFINLLEEIDINEILEQIKNTNS